jgi:GT2 family glycosyltransferase
LKHPLSLGRIPGVFPDQQIPRCQRGQAVDGIRDCSQDPRLSVIVLNHNGIRFVERCISSIIATNYPCMEVIVVDNASVDGSYELLVSLTADRSNVRLIRTDRNLGYAGGNNMGYSLASGEILLFLNVDTVVSPDSLRELVAVFKSANTIAVVQPRLLSLSRNGKLDSDGGYLDRMGYVYTLGDWYGVKPTSIGPEPFYAEGAALAIRREILEKVLLEGAPFDEDYFAYYEDSDLCWRVRLMGFGVVCAPTSIVYHYRSYVTHKMDSTAVYHFTKNHISTLLKNYGARNLMMWFPLMVFFEIIRVLIFLKTQPMSSRAKLLAFTWCLKKGRRLFTKRAMVQSKMRRVPDWRVTEWMVRPNFARILHVLIRS